MALSTQSVVSDGTLSVLDVSIEYFSRDEIHVFFDDVEDAREWAWVGTSDSRITFTPDVANGVEVTLQRRTNVEDLRHVFALGAAFRASTVDEDFLQILRIAQEASENIWDGRFRLDLNMLGHRVTRVGNALVSSDAVPYGQMTSETRGYSDARLVESKAYTDSVAAEGTAKAVRTPENVTALPAAAARANRLMSFDALGNPSTALPVSDSAQGLRLELAAQTGSTKVGNIQPEAGAQFQLVSDIVKDLQTPAGYATMQNALDAKRGLNSNLFLPAAQYNVSTLLSMNAYLYFTGVGDAAQIKLAAGGGLRYVAAGAVFDDHPHKTLADFRVSGDGTFQNYPTPQNGTTIGLSNNTGGGHFWKMAGLTLEMHDTGRSLTNNFSSFGEYNYFRANKIGARFDGVTSYTERDSYFRYNSTAAVYITGPTQNLTFEGGAMENNPGRAIWATGISAGTPFTLSLLNQYFEGNGDQAAGIPAVQVDEHPHTLVRVIGGSFKQNVVGSRVNGEYRWGTSVVMDGVVMGGRHFAQRVALRGDCDFGDDTSWNTLFTAATGIARGLVAPAILTEYSARFAGINPFGAVFQVQALGKSTRVSPTFANLAAAAYPHITSKAASVGLTENAGAAYGDGSWSEIAFPATAGDFNNNWITLQMFTDASSLKPFRVATFLLRPTADIDIGLISSGGAQNLAAFFRLKAGETYRMMSLMVRPGAGTCNLRMFSIQASPAPILFLPHSAYMVGTLPEFNAVVGSVIRGNL